MNRVLEVTAAICLGALLWSPLVHAQTTGSISGTVTDPTGAAARNAKVTLTVPATGLTREATTSDTGESKFDDNSKMK